MMWSWVLTAVGVLGLFVAGSSRYGWLISLGNQALWITYAVVTKQYGFIVASLCYGFVFARNFRLAYRRQLGMEE